MKDPVELPSSNTIVDFLIISMIILLNHFRKTFDERSTWSI